MLGLLTSLAPSPRPSLQPSPQSSTVPSTFRFVDSAAAAGLDVTVWCGRPDKPHILESGGSGLALFDYDADGDLDLYVVNGWRLEATKVIERGQDRLYRNRGDGSFEDVTAEVGLGHDGWGTGVTVGDVDADADLDLVVTNFGPDILYLNDGKGRFSAEPAFTGGPGWSTGAVLFDADGDDDLDLFVAAYIETTLDDVLAATPELAWRGVQVMRGPFGLEGERNLYFENDGGGRFTEVTSEAGLEDAGRYYSFGVAAADFDADLDLDLYVANDSNPNYLYQNEGNGRFVEVGLWSGAALDESGVAQAGMGVAVGDYDDDGRPDVFVTHFSEDHSTLYRNLGELFFEDGTTAAGLHDPTFMPLSWGTALSDFDLDGDLDLFVANGHIYPQAEGFADDGFSFRQSNQILANDGARFVDVSTTAGPGLAVVESSRGTAAGDVDNDGDIDLVVSNVDAPPTLLINESPRSGNWLAVDAPGALRVEVELGDRRWVRHRVFGGSYVSASDPRFHFGLGAAPTIDRLRVVWPDGAEQVLEGVRTDRIVRVTREGRVGSARASRAARLTQPVGADSGRTDDR